MYGEVQPTTWEALRDDLLHRQRIAQHNAQLQKQHKQVRSIPARRRQVVDTLLAILLVVAFAYLCYRTL